MSQQSVSGVMPVPALSVSEFKVYGISLPVFLGIAVVVSFATYFGTLSTDTTGTLALLLVIGYTFGAIGDRIPIWKDYVGGGNILAFLGSAVLLSVGLIPAKYAKAITVFIDKPQGILDFFICVLITGSILSLNRKLLIRSLAVYIPTILTGVALAFLFGITAGWLCGVPIKRVVFMYVLPIMGGGNGAGAIPLSQMWQQITGGSAKEYYSIAISILTIGDIISIVAAALLYRLGQAKPSLSGNGELLRTASVEKAEAPGEKITLTAYDIFNGLFLAGAFHALASIVAKKFLPSIGGIIIHQYAYMIILVAIANGLGIIPASLREGAKRMQKAFTDHVIWIILAGVGIAYIDFDKLLGVITPVNFIIAAAIVLGAMLGPFLFSFVVGFFPVESAIAAGLCMSARGGVGGVRVLGAARRMMLIPYAQISTRLGGGIILVIASVLFSMFGQGYQH